MHEVLVNRLGGLSLPRKSVVRVTDRPDMTLDVNRGRKTTIQQKQRHLKNIRLMTISKLFWEENHVLYRQLNEYGTVNQQKRMIQINLHDQTQLVTMFFSRIEM